jgi:hypothetical protein
LRKEEEEEEEELTAESLRTQRNTAESDSLSVLSDSAVHPSPFVTETNQEKTTVTARWLIIVVCFAGALIRVPPAECG